ncbi:MAG: hypothetical protein JNM13_17510 [Hyphomicrobiaceae bacterium]|nr:hypothetical protein [Hyphomicrobiaceae bacterium]
MRVRAAALPIALAIAVLMSPPGLAQPLDSCAPADRAPAGTLRLSELRRQIAGEIVRAAVCRVSDQWVYRVTVLEPNGQVRTIVFDATNGKSLNR